VINLDRKVILPGSTIGIIGGGQLGRMMALAAKQAGFRIVVLDPAFNSPCGQVADEQIVTDYDDYDGLRQLADKCDVITYEFENIDYEALKKLTGIAYIPQGAELIRITQNRIIEKDTLVRSGVQVAPYEAIYTYEDLIGAISRIGYPCIIKTAQGGYDGKGQMTLKSDDDIQAAAPLIEHGPCVLEKMINFEKELSVIVARNETREMTCFPVVENIHFEHILHKTIAPARINSTVEKAAKAIAVKIAQYVDLIGTLAVEMFLTSTGEVYVNELAPRPHNSGHYSIEACNISQFGQHIRAICNWPLQEIELLKSAIMVNILGQHVDNLNKQIPYQSAWFIHLYGKDQAKYQRKMGHVTILTEDVETTLDMLNQTGIWKDVKKKSEAFIHD